ncbi:MAG: 4-alpha-glucanotransferase, partial [Saprospiraceae bacterium]|nr:4-alpha-glucanotransferase [Saprospiraceae bacterium]
MLLHFHLHYKTILGQQIGIEYFMDDDPKMKKLLFQTFDGQNWTGVMNLEGKTTIFTYNYIIVDNEGLSLREWGNARIISPGENKNVFIEDQWRSRDNENNAFFSSAFTEAIFKRNKKPVKALKKDKRLTNFNKITFRLHSATIPSHLSFGISGNDPSLGSWTTALLLNDSHFPICELTIPNEHLNIHLEYKYVLVEPDTKKIVLWEEGNNRLCHFVVPDFDNNQLIITDEHFRYGKPNWRGSGVAIPVFSLRSRKGLGIGEFSDLKALVDWTKVIGSNIIQVLPVNDTIANKTWVDSYPYASISVFALHPLYINLQNIALLKSISDQKALQKSTDDLNALESVDFEKVLETKFFYLRKLFAQEYDHFIKDREVMLFLEENKTWIKSYAVFCHLRDKFKTCNFNAWSTYSTFSTDVIEALCNEQYSEYRDIQFYYFLQYHADKQLLEARDYARKNGVVLKGDLPIGIYRYSCDAWVAPELYNMNEQAGAPPDDYAVLGQNWGFPTYNWVEMSKNGFLWWRQRMQQLNRYFDALRIDHILGFFRIWYIPTNQVEGTMGLFNPRIPLSKEELVQYGITGDLTRYTTPYNTLHILSQTFGNDMDEVFDIFFSKLPDGRIVFKTSFDT